VSGPPWRPVTRLLVANRGEIARRIIRTAREMGIVTAAVYVPADADAPHVAEADAAVVLGGGSYLDGGALLAAARAVDADAVHPGYGFLSENAAFARSVEAAGLIWVGPPPAAIAAMGDKLAAKQLAGAAGVPTLPTASGPEDAATVGFPLLVKATAGGGGKGMRVVHGPAELAEALAAARREALGGFGDDRVFLERYVPRARHIEVQILGDHHGGLVHLGERECSIQRRHQKIVEEAPSPVVDPILRAELGAAAVALGRALSYASTGTVEFLVDDTPGADGRRPFWFLEVNTRLQVEHPVTEAVTGLDLVRQQLRIAAGAPLELRQGDVALVGHAVEVRLYAEDPAAGFLPAAGTLHGWLPASSPSVRWDSGVEAGSVVGTAFDPLLAKVIAHAPTRAEAAARLALALERTHIAGVTTNRDLLVGLLRHPAFLAGDTTTDFLERHRPPLVRPVDAGQLWRAGVAAALWLQGANRAGAGVLAGLPSGWRNGRLPDQRVTLRRAGTETTVAYRRGRDGSFLVDGRAVAVIHAHSAQAIDVELEGRRLRARVTRHADRLVVHDGSGDVDFEVVGRFAPPGAADPQGGLVAPMPGRVLDVRVGPGDAVLVGELLVVLEAMKMEHRIVAPAAGTVLEVLVARDEQVQTGQTLLVVDHPSATGAA